MALFTACDGKRVVFPTNTGVVWTRLTPDAILQAVFPDVRNDSLVFSSGGIQVNGVITRFRLGVMPLDGSGYYLYSTYPGPAPWEDVRPRYVDRGTVIFQTSRGGTYDLYYRDLDNFVDRRLTSDPVNESAPAPRPNAPGLVYIEYDNDGTTPGSADTRGRVVLIPDTSAVPLAKVYLTSDTLRCGQPDWDPTGTKICFSVENAQDLTRHIFTINLAPGDSLPVQITAGPFYDNSPRWSPDGNRILFLSDRTGRQGLWVVHPSGEGHGLQLMAFEDAGGVLASPAWTSDGLGIVVSSDARTPRVNPTDPADQRHIRALWHLTNLPPFEF